MRPTVQVIQRLLAEEFEQRGWEYDLSTARAIADEVMRAERVDAVALARLAGAGFRARNSASQSDVAESVATALAELPLDEVPLPDLGELRILFVAASPSDERPLRLAAEHRDIRMGVRSATNRDRVRMEATLAARPADLIDELNRFRPTVLHLAGHGGPTGIALEDSCGTAADVSSDQLKRLVGVAGDSLRLVVLNSCDSAHQALPISEDLDSAIGMSRAIGDAAARVFAVQLYSSLAEGIPLGRAFEQARLSIDLAGLPDDDIPQLFMWTANAADTVFI